MCRSKCIHGWTLNILAKSCEAQHDAESETQLISFKPGCYDHILSGWQESTTKSKYKSTSQHCIEVLLDTPNTENELSNCKDNCEENCTKSKPKFVHKDAAKDRQNHVWKSIDCIQCTELSFRQVKRFFSQLGFDSCRIIIAEVAAREENCR